MREIVERALTELCRRGRAGYVPRLFKRLGDGQLLFLIAEASKYPQAQQIFEMSRKEFCLRGYQEYVSRIYRVIKEHLISPFSHDHLVPLVFVNATKEAPNFSLPRQVVGAAKERQTINHWLRTFICETILTQSSDKELMAQMARRDEGDVAQQSFALKARWELQSRHETAVRKYFLARLRGTFDESVAHDLTGDTFERVFQRAHTYRDTSTENPEQSRWLTRAWILKIGRNVYVDLLRKLNVKHLVDFDSLEANQALVWQCKAWADSAADGADGPATCQDEHLECMKRAVEVLTARERDILIAKNDFYYNKQERDAAVRAIEEVYGITPDNKRKISSRALRKMDDHRAVHCEVCKQRVRRKRHRKKRGMPTDE
jgi:DNA-directed RNA polymerase specialized sigma24 family protein